MLSLLLRSLRARERTATATDRSSLVLPRLEGVDKLLENGALEAVERMARERLELAPDDTEGLAALAGVMAERGMFVDACALADRVTTRAGVRPDQLCAAAEINRRAGCHAQTLSLAERAAAAEPRLALPWILQAMSLETLGRPAEACDAYHKAICLDPQNRHIHSSLLYMLYSSGLFPAARIVEEHRAWAARHADPLTPADFRHANEPDHGRPLKVGYVSPDFRRHVVAQFIEPVLARHDRRDFRVYCYSACPRPDDRTAGLRKLADEWRDIAPLDDAAAAQQIREDGIDLLVDLAGHTRGNRLALFARKPSPVQISWLGYLGTTGMSAMDYCITDTFTDPPGVSDGHYTEKLLRLPIPQWCYGAPSEAPPVTALPALQQGYVTFGSVANYARLNAETFHAWARILRAVPQARLRVFGVTPGDPTDRMLEPLEAAGIEAGRVDLVGQLPYAAYLCELRSLDILLGSFPYTGATTTCEALWMGLPTICIAGNSRPARSSASIVSALGLNGLVAADWDGYCANAVRLATELDSLSRLRAGLRERIRGSPVMDAQAFTRALEKAYRDAWQNWCGSTAARAFRAAISHGSR